MSTKRKKQLREFMNINNTELRQVTNHTSTRLLSLGKCPGKTLMQWDSLESHFLFNFDLDEDPAESEPDENPSREKRLVNVFEKPVSKLYSMFVKSAIPIFDSFNTFLQAEEPLIQRTTDILYHSTLLLHCSLLLRFIMSEVISEYDDVLSIDLEGSDFLKDFNSIFVGAITKQYTREIIQTSELIKLLTEVRAFFIKCANI